MDNLTASTSKTISPSITAQAEAQEEADRLNAINQSVIGAKEGVVEAITKLVGSAVTNAILWTANGSDHKSINNFMLFEVMKSAIDGANQPSTNDMLEQLLKVINHNFNFCKKVSFNMELMQPNAAQMATYSIIICIPQLTLTLFANIETATKSDYGHEICSAMHAIRKKYTCMVQLCFSLFSRSWWAPMAYASSKMHWHQARGPCTRFPNQFPTSKQ